jgi:heterodisulfide reductase subunit A
VRLNTIVTAASGQGGAFDVTLTNGHGTGEPAAGAVIIATGFKHFDPGRETQRTATTSTTTSSR